MRHRERLHQNSYRKSHPSTDGRNSGYCAINLPHTRFQLARGEAGSGPAMIGIIEDAANLYEDPNVTVPIVKDYGHRNNSIWMFRVSATDGQIYAKVLPSRRDVNGSATENV